MGGAGLFYFARSHTTGTMTAECLANAAADHAFVTAVQERPAAGCGAKAYVRIDRLARLLSAAAQGSCPAFGYHGMWGVFSEPPKVARPNRAQKANVQLFTYGSSKAAFLHNETCAHGVGEPVHQICEVGFNAGNGGGGRGRARAGKPGVRSLYAIRFGERKLKGNLKEVKREFKKKGTKRGVINVVIVVVVVVVCF